MTFRGRRPSSASRDEELTAYERRAGPARSFDYDALSEMTVPGVWPGTIEDVESLTLLSGLEGGEAGVESPDSTTD